MAAGSNYLHLGDELADDGEYRVTETVSLYTALYTSLYTSEYRVTETV
jgi:hypothetical protein